jgi:hypothetical protein
MTGMFCNNLAEIKPCCHLRTAENQLSVCQVQKQSNLKCNDIQGDSEGRSIFWEVIVSVIVKKEKLIRTCV